MQTGVTFSCTFVSRFEHNDPFMTNFIRLLDAMNDAFTEGLLADFIPGFKYIPTKGLTLFRESIDVMIKMVKDIYEEHKTNFDEGTLNKFFLEIRLLHMVMTIIFHQSKVKL